MRDTKLFISKGLLLLTVADSRAFEEITGEPVGYFDWSVIFAGNFNINFLCQRHDFWPMTLCQSLNHCYIFSKKICFENDQQQKLSYYQRWYYYRRFIRWYIHQKDCKYKNLNILYYSSAIITIVSFTRLTDEQSGKHFKQENWTKLLN